MCGIWHIPISCFSKYLPERWKISGQTNSNLRSIMPLYIHFTCLQISTVCGHLDIIKVLQKHKIGQDSTTKITCHIENFWIRHFKTWKKSAVFFRFRFTQLVKFIELFWIYLLVNHKTILQIWSSKVYRKKLKLPFSASSEVWIKKTGLAIFYPIF